MNLAILTHKAANSPEFRSGFPPDWPYVAPVEIGDSTTVPTGLRGWVVISKEAHQKYLTDNAQAVADWSAAQKEAEDSAPEKLASVAKAAETNAAIADVEAVFKAWESADEKSRGEILHKLLHLILQLLKDLGSPIQTIEKPTEKR